MQKNRDEDTYFALNKQLKIGTKRLVFDQTKIMGIVNLTEDSFYSPSRVKGQDALCERVAQMIIDGVDVLDLGAASSRPGATFVEPEKEIDLLSKAIPLVKEIIGSKDVFISVDTFHTSVAQFSVDIGADLINDISAGELDQQMIPFIHASKTPYIAMHMRGTPKNMMNFTSYSNVTEEILNFFKARLLEWGEKGMQNIMIDPGIGFAKSSDQNFEILRNYQAFHELKVPLLMGISRKSLIQKTLGVDAENALNGSTILHTYLIEKGVDMIRTHDVKELKEATTLLKRIHKA